MVTAFPHEKPPVQISTDGVQQVTGIHDRRSDTPTTNRPTRHVSFVPSRLTSSRTIKAFHFGFMAGAL